MSGIPLWGSDISGFHYLYNPLYQESVDVYRRYALVKTRMLPYLRVAVREARATGLPVMRHTYFSNPSDPRVYTMQDQYMYGDALLVAPVVACGLTSRSVYLPEGSHFDYWTGERVAGHADVVAQAPLDTVPVFARLGAIVPCSRPTWRRSFLRAIAASCRCRTVTVPRSAGLRRGLVVGHAR